MMDRRWVALVMTIVGFAMIVVAIVGLLGSGGSSDDGAGEESIATVAPSTSAATSTTTSRTPTTTTTSSTTSSTTSTTTTMSTVPGEDPEQFLRLLVDGLRGDVDFLVARLNEKTIAIYGEDQCRTALAGLLDPQAELEIREIGPIAPWDYVVDGITTRVPDALPVEVQRLAAGETIIQELHWQLVDGSWTWFSDCGDPIAG